MTPVGLDPPDPVGTTSLGRLVADAVEAVARAWPLDSFVAVNPLAGWEDQHFEDAVADASTTFGARTLPSEQDQRRDLAAGRLGAADLAEALAERGACRRATADAAGAGADIDADIDAASVDPVLGCSPLDLLVADLLVAPSAPPPGRMVLTPAEQLDARDGGRRAAAIDEQVAAWCAVVLDDHATWRPPRVELGLWGAWRYMNQRDRRLPVEVRELVATLPDHPIDAVGVLLVELGVGAADAPDVLRAEFTRLPGWVTHLRSRAAAEGDRSAAADEVVGFLAVRLGVEALVVGHRVPPGADAPTELAGIPGSADPGPPDVAGSGAAPAPAVPAPVALARAAAALERSGGRSDTEAVALAAALLEAIATDERELVWLEAAESAYRRQLLTSLAPLAPSTPRGPARGITIRPPSQILCCIDVRSEGLRRHLERLAGWETFGIAGFFALAIRFRREHEALVTERCPVILAPDLDAVEHLDATPHGWRSDATYAIGEDAFHSAKEGITAPLALAEIAGWFAGPEAAMRTFLPGRLRRRPAGVPSHVELPGVEPARRVELAAGLLGAIGLTSQFARLVLLCGHGSVTVNNPYAAGLDCGACGGQPGAQNARVGAGLLNDPVVRDGLAEQGVRIPDDTWFLAGEHNTASDEVALFDLDAVPPSHTDDLRAVRAQLAAAGHALRAERARQLPGVASGRERPGGGLRNRDDRRLLRRGQDWAEVVPEWGLAGNAAMVIAPRSVTAPVDLGRRVFLHSYEADQDPDGRVLAVILGGPLVVGHWISSQYFFSTVDPEAFGAGTKATHNVLGGVVTLSGPEGDLRRGLPLQSFGVGDERIHQALRLLAVIQAPLDRIDAALAETPSARRLVEGGWVALAARDDAGSPWAGHLDGAWTPWPGLGNAPAPSSDAPSPESTSPESTSPESTSPESTSPESTSPESPIAPPGATT